MNLGRFRFRAASACGVYLPTSNPVDAVAQYVTRSGPNRLIKWIRIQKMEPFVRVVQFGRVDLNPNTRIHIWILPRTIRYRPRQSDPYRSSGIRSDNLIRSKFKNPHGVGQIFLHQTLATGRVGVLASFSL